MEITIIPLLIIIVIVLIVLYLLYSLIKKLSGGQNLQEKYKVNILSTTAIKGEKDKFKMTYQLLNDKGSVVRDKKLKFIPNPNPRINGDAKEIGTFSLVSGDGQAKYETTIIDSSPSTPYYKIKGQNGLPNLRISTPIKLVEFSIEEVSKDPGNNNLIVLEYQLIPLNSNVNVDHYKVQEFVEVNPASNTGYLDGATIGKFNIEFILNTNQSAGNKIIDIAMYSGSSNPTYEVEVIHLYTSPPPGQDAEHLMDPRP